MAPAASTRGKAALDFNPAEPVQLLCHSNAKGDGDASSSRVPATPGVSSQGAFKSSCGAITPTPHVPAPRNRVSEAGGGNLAATAAPKVLPSASSTVFNQVAPELALDDGRPWTTVKPRRWWRKRALPLSDGDSSRRAGPSPTGAKASGAPTDFTRRFSGRCFRCLSKDHRVASCREPLKCLGCSQPGHGVLMVVVSDPNPVVNSNTFKAAKALELQLGIPWSDMRVTRHYPEQFLAWLKHPSQVELALGAHSVEHDGTVYSLKQWSEAKDVIHRTWWFRCCVALENLPLFAWDAECVEEIIGNHCRFDRLLPTDLPCGAPQLAKDVALHLDPRLTGRGFCRGRKQAGCAKPSQGCRLGSLPEDDEDDDQMDVRHPRNNSRARRYLDAMTGRRANNGGRNEDAVGASRDGRRRTRSSRHHRKASTDAGPRTRSRSGGPRRLGSSRSRSPGQLRGVVKRRSGPTSLKTTLHDVAPDSTLPDTAANPQLDYDPLAYLFQQDLLHLQFDSLACVDPMLDELVAHCVPQRLGLAGSSAQCTPTQYYNGGFLSSDNAVEVALLFEIDPRAVGELFPATGSLRQQERSRLVLRGGAGVMLHFA
ncbi:hypothetical protein PR202_ga09715 [Eleusine coracana subsp. coracana]|uniref:DUF4283 domain-containing protein n=1 Tax=Eleusine coracana subsp. coracana TaxID=191504 RepID=A0AAV5C3R5_ELECO|nr:hypothetical protein PR202_ga09715 [Eleusine coracana subsp. coracana]